MRLPLAVAGIWLAMGVVFTAAAGLGGVLGGVL